MIVHFIIYFIFIFLSIGIFIISQNLPGREYGAASPAFFPQILAISFFFFSILGIIELLKKRRHRRTDSFSIPSKVLIAMGISIGYILTMKLMGYFPSTFVFVFGIMLLFRDGTPNILYILINSLVLTGIAFVLFKLMLNAYLPKGILF
jgi:hypothetical protein